MEDTMMDHESEEWTRARKRVTDRRELGSHVVAYVVVWTDNGSFTSTTVTPI